MTSLIDFDWACQVPKQKQTKKPKYLYKHHIHFEMFWSFFFFAYFQFGLRIFFAYKLHFTEKFILKICKAFHSKNFIALILKLQDKIKSIDGILKPKISRSAWVAHLVGQLTFDFSSDYEFKPHGGLHTRHGPYFKKNRVNT